MNGSIFKLFGYAILIFNFFLVLVLAVRLTRHGFSPRMFIEFQLIFFGFVIVSTLIALGIITLQRWAAVALSALGFTWGLALAMVLGSKPWASTLVGMPVVFGMLLPLYATTRYWSSLKATEATQLKSFVDALRSSDPLHLK